MNGKWVVTTARQEKTRFGVKYSKFAGAVSVEILRVALAGEGIATSSRDVFVRGVPLEIDVLVPRGGQTPSLGLLYEPDQVAAALEVKNSGSFGEGTLEKVRRDFGRLREVGIRGAYVTLEERHGYKWAASNERLGFPCFTLAWHRQSAGAFDLTEDWIELLKFLRQCMVPDRA